MINLSRCFNIADLRLAAQRRLPKGIFEFVDRGAEDELALRDNRLAFERLKFSPHVLRDVSQRSTATTLFGKKLPLPMAVAPTGAAGLCWFEGELELAKAAAKAGVPFAMATGSLTAMEKIAEVAGKAAGGQLWMQLYMWRDRELSYELVRRAHRAGWEALLLTVDTAVAPNREYNGRNGFSLPYQVSARSIVDMALHPGWTLGTMGAYWRDRGMPRHENYPAAYQRSITADPGNKTAMRNDTLCFDDIGRLRDIWPGTLMIKGVMRADDAARCAELGADAVIVSNHGGRNLDGARPTLDILPEVAAAIGRRIPVLVDSGIRRGADIVKAVALGADAVLTGRATLYGTAAAGEAGAAHAIRLLQKEMDTVMAYVGVNSVAEIGPDILHLPPPDSAPAVPRRQPAYETA